MGFYLLYHLLKNLKYEATDQNNTPIKINVR